MKNILVLSFVLLSAFTIKAGENDVFKIGNDAYLKNNYSTAIASYRQLINEGYQSSELYFNLANAYFKTDSIANAILYYEKAKKLAPADEDILANLKLANLKTIDKTEAKEQLIFKSWWDNFVHSHSADDWGIACIVALFIAFSLLVVFRISSSTLNKQVFFGSFCLAVLIAATFYLLAKTNYSQQHAESEAILFNSSATIKSAPSENSKDLFIIHEGTKVNIIEKDNSWFRIRLDNGNEGWMKESAVKII